MLDIAGNLLEVGDRVAFAQAGYTNLYHATVVGFTAKQVRVQENPELDEGVDCVDINPDYEPSLFLRSPHNLVKLNTDRKRK